MLKKHFGDLETRHKPYNKFLNWDNTPIKCNSLGYRSEEYNPKAKLKLFVCGCSYTMGSGLLFKNTWPQQFKKLFTKNKKVKLSDFNLLNFSLEGASNNYITRTILSQCSQIKPNLVIIYFTHCERSERIKNSSILNVAPFVLNHNNPNFNPRDKHVIKTSSFYDFYTDEIGFMNLIKNIFLLQNHFKRYKIKYIFSCVDIDMFSNVKFTSNLACKQYLDLIDMNHICGFKLQQIDNGLDRKTKINEKGEVVVGGHPGPKSNKLFARKLFKFYRERIANKSNL